MAAPAPPPPAGSAPRVLDGVAACFDLPLERQTHSTDCGRSSLVQPQEGGPRGPVGVRAAPSGGCPACPGYGPLDAPESAAGAALERQRADAEAQMELLVRGVQRKGRGPFVYSHADSEAVRALAAQAARAPRVSRPWHDTGMDLEAISCDAAVKSGFLLPELGRSAIVGGIPGSGEPAQRPPASTARPKSEIAGGSPVRKTYPRAPRSPARPEYSNALLRERRHERARREAEESLVSRPPFRDARARRDALVEELSRELGARDGLRYTKSSLDAYRRSSLHEAAERQHEEHPFVPKRDWDRPAHEPEPGEHGRFVEREDAYAGPYRVDGALFSEIRGERPGLVTLRYAEAKRGKKDGEFGPLGDVVVRDPFSAADADAAGAYASPASRGASRGAAEIPPPIPSLNYDEEIARRAQDPAELQHHRKPGFTKESIEKHYDKSFLDVVEVKESKEDFMPLYSSFTKDGYFREPLLPQIRIPNSERDARGQRILTGKAMRRPRAAPLSAHPGSVGRAGVAGTVGAIGATGAASAYGSLLGSAAGFPLTSAGGLPGGLSVNTARGSSAALASLTATYVPGQPTWTRKPRGTITLAERSASALACPQSALGSTKLSTGPVLDFDE